MKAIWKASVDALPVVVMYWAWVAINYPLIPVLVIDHEGNARVHYVRRSTPDA